MAANRPTQKARLAIVGGGITGLAAAHRFRQLSLRASTPTERDENELDCVVLEASARLGGSIRTESHDGFLVEAAPDSLVTHKPAGVELCRELGIESQLIEPRPLDYPTTQVVYRGRLVPLPDGLQLAAATKILPVLTSRLFSLNGKIRLLSERKVSPARTEGDEPLGAFVSRRFGREAFERVVEPVMGGLFTADAQALSTQLVMPRLLALEQRFGSVTAGILEARKTATNPPPPPQLALNGGMQTLIDRLAETLGGQGLWTDAAVEHLAYDPHTEAWSIDILDRPTVIARALVLAVPGHVASALLRQTDQEASSDAATLEYASCATVSLGYPRSALRKPLRGFGFFVPKGESWPFLACSYPSSKFDGRAAEGQVLLRAFVGGVQAPEAMRAEDHEMVAAVQRGLARLLRMRAEPSLSVVHRHQRAMPQFVAGYGETIERLEKRLRQLPGLEVAGSVQGAYGLPDCIRSGQQAADRAREHLSKPGP